MDANSEDRLRANIGDAIMGMRREGTTGCSLPNLKQMTSTRGLSCPVGQYHAEFDGIARDVAKSIRFRVYGGGK